MKRSSLQWVGLLLLLSLTVSHAVEVSKRINHASHKHKRRRALRGWRDDMQEAAHSGWETFKKDMVKSYHFVADPVNEKIRQAEDFIHFLEILLADTVQDLNPKSIQQCKTPEVKVEEGMLRDTLSKVRKEAFADKECTVKKQLFDKVYQAIKAKWGPQIEEMEKAVKENKADKNVKAIVAALNAFRTAVNAAADIAQASAEVAKLAHAVETAKQLAYVAGILAGPSCEVCSVLYLVISVAVWAYETNCKMNEYRLLESEVVPWRVVDACSYPKVSKEKDSPAKTWFKQQCVEEAIEGLKKKGIQCAA